MEIVPMISISWKKLSKYCASVIDNATSSTVKSTMLMDMIKSVQTLVEKSMSFAISGKIKALSSAICMITMQPLLCMTKRILQAHALL